MLPLRFGDIGEAPEAASLDEAQPHVRPLCPLQAVEVVTLGSIQIPEMKGEVAPHDVALFSRKRGDAKPCLLLQHLASTPEDRLIRQGEQAGSHLCNGPRSEEHTSELQSLMRISYAVFCLKKKKQKQ